GGNLSPLLSNIMLNELDKELKSRGLRFVRYADDCIIMVKSEMAARRVMRSVTKYIEEKLGLIVNIIKSKVTNQIIRNFNCWDLDSLKTIRTLYTKLNHTANQWRTLSIN